MSKNFLALLFNLSLIVVLCRLPGSRQELATPGPMPTPAVETTTFPQEPAISSMPESNGDWEPAGLLQSGEVMVSSSPGSALHKPGTPNILLSPSPNGYQKLDPEKPLSLSGPAFYILISRKGDFRWVGHGSLSVVVKNRKLTLKVPLTRFTGDHIRDYRESLYQSEAVKVEGLRGLYHVYLGDTFVGDVVAPGG